MLIAPAWPVLFLLRFLTLAFQRFHLGLTPNAGFSDHLRWLDLALRDPRLKRLPRDANRIRSLLGGIELLRHRLVYTVHLTVLSRRFIMPAEMLADPYRTRLVEWLFRILAFVAGVVSTVIGSWLSSKIRLYHDHRAAHHEEIKARVLRPLLETAIHHLPLFQHQAPVVTEGWGPLFTKKASVTESNVDYGSILQTSNPWYEALRSVDRALLQDAKRTHLKGLITEVSQLATDWNTHLGHCSNWVNKMAGEILRASKMNPYRLRPLTPPYVLDLRLAIFVYMRLFELPADALRKEANGRYWTIEGAPGAGETIGISSLASEELIDALLQTVNTVMETNQEKARSLLEESSGIALRTAKLRNRLEFAIASKKLRGRCDLVRFF